MNISFKGVKNAGAQMFTREKPEIIKSGPYTTLLPKGKHINLHIELNNEDTNDLDNFKYLLRAFPNKYNKNSMNIEYDEFIHPRFNEKEKFFIINDQIIELNKNTFPVFNQIFKLLKKIETMPPEKLKTENSYVKSLEAIDSFYYYADCFSKTNIDGVMELDKQAFMEMISNAHSPKQAQLGAKALSKRFANVLTEYLLT